MVSHNKKTWCVCVKIVRALCRLYLLSYLYVRHQSKIFIYTASFNPKNLTK